MRRLLAICGIIILVVGGAVAVWPEVGRALIGWRTHPTVGGPIEGVETGQFRNDNSLQMAMVWIDAGRFKMGSPLGEKGRYPNEEQIEAMIDHGFWIGKYEVTQSQWHALMGTSPWRWQPETTNGAEYPATYVTWDDAVSFCSALTKREQDAGQLPPGWEYNVPTEAQWEYACRAGTTTRYSFGNDESQLELYAWYDGNSRRAGEHYAHRVGQKDPNRWGLFDMHGNVMEWCRDEQPWVPKTDFQRRQAAEYGQPRIMVGGSWFHDAEGCRSAFRTGNWRTRRSSYLGFRVALVRTKN
jgi:formylglycine-generating enzyme